MNKKYIIYSQLSFEVEAESVSDAEKLASERMKKIEEEHDVKIDNAKVADQASGYFVKE